MSVKRQRLWTRVYEYLAWQLTQAAGSLIRPRSIDTCSRSPPHSEGRAVLCKTVIFDRANACAAGFSADLLRVLALRALEVRLLEVGLDGAAADDHALDGDQRVDVLRVEVAHRLDLVQVEHADLRHRPSRVRTPTQNTAASHRAGPVDAGYTVHSVPYIYQSTARRRVLLSSPHEIDPPGSASGSAVRRTSARTPAHGARYTQKAAHRRMQNADV